MLLTSDCYEVVPQLQPLSDVNSIATFLAVDSPLLGFKSEVYLKHMNFTLIVSVVEHYNRFSAKTIMSCH
jgi:hypothetical protein